MRNLFGGLGSTVLCCVLVGCSSSNTASPVADGSVSDGASEGAASKDANGGADARHGDSGHTDAAHADAGVVDSGKVDASHLDAGNPDAGPPDAGVSDVSTSDATTSDATATDAAGDGATGDSSMMVDAGVDALVSLCAGVTCIPSDACHTAGTCDPSTGTCSNPPAPDGTACTLAGGAGACESGVCLAECVDGVKDGNETATDCGGGTCPACTSGDACKIDTDCMSQACDAISLTCVVDQCADHREDGLETDIDCGGGVCPACPLADACKADSDCASTACDAISLSCVSSQCGDHRQDGTESDVDCGGTVCAACAVGKHCNTSFDCQGGHVCSTSHVCQ